MATYKDIQLAVRKQANFTPKSYWIADVLSMHGLTLRRAPNRLTGAKRKYPCPDEKRPAIEAVLRQFKMNA